MTHDELLARISLAMPEDNSDVYVEDVVAALRAVVELHKPINYAMGASTAIGNPAYLPTTTACSCSKAFNDYDRVPYPCPTIQAIEKELG